MRAKNMEFDWNMEVKLASNNDATRRKRSAEEIMKDAKHLKTQNKYDKSWQNFLEYHDNETDIRNFNEETFLQYFDFLIREKGFAYSTLWSIFSMLNSESQRRCGPKLNDFPRLVSLIKSKEKNYAPKQGSVLTTENLENFLQDAPVTGLYSLQKAAFVIGIYGGLRCVEMAGLSTDDFSKSPDHGYWVSYNVSKQTQDGIKNRFHIPRKHAGYIKSYLDCIGKHQGRFFLTFVPTNKGDNTIGMFKPQAMGKNTIAKIPCQIATFLNLENAETFTGHSFRRSSATLFADAGATSIDLKKHLNWKSDSVVMRYVNQSSNQKLNMSSLISGESSATSITEKKQVEKVVNMSNCTNVVINI